MRSDLIKLDSFTLEMSKNHLIRNFLRNGRLRVKRSGPYVKVTCQIDGCVEVKGTCERQGPKNTEIHVFRLVATYLNSYEKIEIHLNRLADRMASVRIVISDSVENKLAAK